MKIACVLTSNLTKNQISKINKFKNLIYAIEIRADTFYPNKIHLIKETIELIKNKFPKIKIILTFRKFEEGGKTKISENKRKIIIENLISNFKKFLDFIDIEFNSTIKDDIYEIAKKNKKFIIFSSHFLNSFKEKEIYERLNQISTYLKSKKIKKYIVKIVININNFSKYFEILRKIHQFCLSKGIKNYTFFTTGKTSLISRCVNVILDMPLAYVAVKKPVIKTQPSIDDFIVAIRKLGINTSK